MPIDFLHLGRSWFDCGGHSYLTGVSLLLGTAGSVMSIRQSEGIADQALTTGETCDKGQISSPAPSIDLSHVAL